MVGLKPITETDSTANGEHEGEDTEDSAETLSRLVSIYAFVYSYANTVFDAATPTSSKHISPEQYQTQS